MVITDVNQVTYIGDGITTAWPFTFRIIDASDIQLMIVDADGTETAVTSDYFVDTINNTVYYPGYAPGAEPPEADQPPVLSADQKLIVYRTLPITQEKDLGDKWPFALIELGLDKLTMILQDIWDWCGRCLQVTRGRAVEAGDDFDPTVPLEAGKVICGNEDGTGFEAREAMMEVNGAWDGEGRQIHSVADPTGDQDAATKNYVDTLTDNNFMKLQPDGEAWEGRNLPISNVANPTLQQQAATKNYVDSIIAGIVAAGNDVIVVDNVATMKATDLTDGMYVTTAGYHEVNDGGNGFYAIRVAQVGDVEDGGSIIFLDNGNIAELIMDTGVLNVKQFGAKGDGVTDDTNAIQNCMIYLQKIVPLDTDYYHGGAGRLQDNVDRRTGKIIFPTGVYVVTHNVFNADRIVTNRSPFVGFIFEGVGRTSSVILLKTNGVESWLFYTDASTERFQRMYFIELGFRSDDYRYGNVCTLYSTGTTKQFRFDHCAFSDFNRFMVTKGTGNGDLNEIFGSAGLFYGDILTLDNAQSVQHDFLKSNLSTYGHWVHVIAGGEVSVSNAAFDFMYHDDFSPAGGNHLVYVDDTALNATTTFAFRDCRIEVEAYTRSASNPPFGLVYAPLVGVIRQMRILFDNVIFINGRTYTINAEGTEVSYERRNLENAVNIGNSIFVHFRDCVLLKNFFYKFNGSYNIGSPPYGGIVFIENCYDGKQIELPYADQSTYRMVQSRATYSNNFGRLISRGITDGTSEVTGVVYAHDGDSNWRVSGADDMGVQPVVASLLQRNRGVPLPDGTNEVVIHLNPRTFAKRIYIHKNANGNNSASYQLHIGTDDKSTIIASSTSANGQFKDEHTIDVSNIDLSAYTKLRIWATGDASITTILINQTAYMEYF